MSTKLKSYIKFWPIFLTVVSLLYLNGYGFAKSLSIISALDKNFSLQKEYNQTGTDETASVIKTDTSLSDELPPVTVKENTDGDDDNGSDLLYWSHYEYNHRLIITPHNYSIANSAVAKASRVPLYILFHSWKNFIS